jgi:hypothetical protein
MPMPIPTATTVPTAPRPVGRVDVVRPRATVAVAMAFVAGVQA